MSVILTLIGKTPGSPQFGLDQFTEHYKADATADVVMTDPGVPQRLSAHPDYPFMFITDRHCQETGDKASALDLVYTGCLRDDGGGSPLLPPRQHDSEQQVMSSTSKQLRSGLILTEGATLQYYAPSNTLKYISFLSPGTDTASDPSGDPAGISLTIGDATFNPTSFAQAIAALFGPLVVSALSSTEIIAGKYYQNVSRKTKTLAPWMMSALAPGAYLILWAGGTGYTVGNSLTVSGTGGQSATVTVDALGLSGSITKFTVGSNTFTMSQSFIFASGGSGTGAGFNVVFVP